MEAMQSSERSADSYQSTWHYNPEDCVTFVSLQRFCTVLTQDFNYVSFNRSSVDIFYLCNGLNLIVPYIFY
jgi:hypothetical protein